MLYQIRSRDLKGIVIEFRYLDEAKDWYDKYEPSITNKKTNYYGYVLVQTKRIKTGFEIKFSFDTCWTQWKPRFRWNKWEKTFQWLWFYIFFNYNYTDKFDKVIQDFLEEK